MKEIPLTKGKVTLVDNEDYDRLVAMGKWYCSCFGYACKSVRFMKSDGVSATKNISMHRSIINPGDDMVVDHIDGNKLNNQKANLRICTSAENTRNQLKPRNNISGYKGVWFRKDRNKYMAYICFNKKHIHLGLFKCPIEAAKAYNAGAVKYYGEFANLNEIPG